jgi:hypothetical protein
MLSTPHTLDVDVENTMRDRRKTGWRADALLPKGRYLVGQRQEPVEDGMPARERVWIRLPTRHGSLGAYRRDGQTWAEAAESYREYRGEAFLACKLMEVLVPDPSLAGFLAACAEDYVPAQRILCKLHEAGVVSFDAVKVAAHAVQRDMEREED